jgi:hypothetical protein
MEVRRFDAWEPLRAFLEEPATGGVTYYWRGQRDPCWPLASSLARRLRTRAERARRAGRSPTKEYEQLVREHLERFKSAASGLRGSAPKDLTEEQWWALGRHYGLATPLLDWTEKPYIALFFALRGAVPVDDVESAEPDDRFALFRLGDGPELREAAAEGDLAIVRTPIDELGRMQQQRGLFTWLRSDRYFDLGDLLERTGRGSLLVQANVSSSVLPRALRDLELHGIDHRMLFPDLYGAARHANAVLDVDGWVDR